METTARRLAWVVGVALAFGARAADVPVQPALETKAEKRVVFVAPFENVTGDRQYDPAAQGMVDLLGVLLAEQEQITVVERQHFNRVVQEQKLALSGAMDAKRLVQVGQLLKADIVIMGRLYLVKKQLSVTAAAIEVKTARVSAQETVSCRPENLLEDSLQLAIKLAVQMKRPLPKINLDEIDKSPAASLHFGQGISLYYAGNMDEAIMQFMRTVDLDPGYPEAYYWSGLCYSRLKEYDDAGMDLSRYLEESPQGRYAAEARSLLEECRKHPTPPLLPGILPEKKRGGP